MKKAVYMFILSGVLITGQTDASGQDNSGKDPILEIFDKYEEKEGAESITISPALLKLMKNGKNNDQKTKDLISKISGLRILMFNDREGKGKPNREAFTAELQSAIRNGYEEIMKVKSTGERIELYIRNASNCKDCKSALLFITAADTSVTVMLLSGTIDQTLIDAVMNGEIGTSTSGK